MNQKHTKQITTTALLAILSFTGCSLQKDIAPTVQGQNASTVNPADQKGIVGVPGANGPTSDAVIKKITTNLLLPAGTITKTSSNTFKAIAALSGNLPQTTNPLQATGYDQIPLLAHAACADVPYTNAATNATPGYGITGTTIPAARASLIAAGVQIVDSYTGGLGSTGPNASQVSAIFGTLVDTDAAISGDTVQMAFISVCTAASVFGAGMMGF